MSEESISYGEDKENLLYISKKINVDEFGLGEEGLFRESIQTDESELNIKPFGSEIQLLEDAGLPQTFSDPQIARRFKPFHLKWSYGINDKVGLINLTTATRKELFFSCVHSAVLYNYCTKEMRHLEGHQALVNCISSDSDGDWLVTTDKDADGCLIVWCSKTLLPVFTLFKPYPLSGILLTAMSPCARYLITIGETEENYDNYSVDFWLWTTGEEKPNDTYLVHKVHGLPVKICFNPDVEEHIMLVFKKQVFLIVWDSEAKKILPAVIPTITNKDKVGALTCGTFMKQCHESYVSSTRGCILVFRNTLFGRNFEEAELSNSKMYINAVKITTAPIDTITTTEGVLVIGDSKGHILFFDKRIRILYWIRNLGIGAITGLSFSISPKGYQQENSKLVITDKPLDDETILDCKFYDKEEEITKLVDAPFDATGEHKPFAVGDFFLSTADCNIYAYDFINNTCTALFHVTDANISAIDAHDEMSYIVIGYENGRLALIDFEKKEQILTYILPKTDETNDGGDIITCIKYSHESLHLVCGRNNGEVWVLEPVILRPKIATPFKYSHTKIESIDFSYNSLQFAYFDSNRTVVLFNYITEENCWKFRGKVRSHYDQIHDIRFIYSQEGDSSILYTIGADRYFVEYNNLDLRYDDDQEFNTTMRERIEQTAIPMNFTYYERHIGGRNVGYIVLADNKQKAKVIHAATKVVRSLVLGPSFGCFKDSNVTKMRVIPHQNSRYLIFISNRYIGIQILPLDGNPFKYTGYLAHPRKIADFALSYNGMFAFTYGVEDRCILQWEIRPRSVELLAIGGGTELEPYYCLLEGGKNGWLFQEIQDLFFYMQILQQENIDLPRRVSDNISLTEVPHLVRTCGFYPSKFELETMMIDIRYRDFDECGIVRHEISFVEFVKLFINHRPTYGYSVDEIRKNFYTICMMADYPRRNRIESHDLIYLLQTVGEPSPNLHKNLTTLLRVSAPADDDNFEFLPHEINTKFIFDELLGIDPENVDKEEKDTDADDDVGIAYF